MALMMGKSPYRVCLFFLVSLMDVTERLHDYSQGTQYGKDILKLRFFLLLLSGFHAHLQMLFYASRISEHYISA